MRKIEKQSLTVKEFFRQLFLDTDIGIFIVALLLLMIAGLMCLAGMKLEAPKENKPSKIHRKEIITLECNIGTLLHKSTIFQHMDDGVHGEMVNVYLLMNRKEYILYEKT